MRNQYVGDVSDLIKYALLRALTANDRSLGIAWYYNPDNDGRNDGRHREYLKEDKWLHLDGDLLQALKTLSSRSVAAVEKLPIWPKRTRFYSQQVPVNKDSRNEWRDEIYKNLAGCDLVFLDPDNGASDKYSERHVTYDEIKYYRRSKRAILLIKFPARVKFDKQEKEYHAKLAACENDNIVTLQTYVTVPSKSGRKVPRFRWFTLIDADDVLKKRFIDFGKTLNQLK